MSSPLMRKRLGRRLATEREKAGKTQQEVASAKVMGSNKLGLIETGRQEASVGDVFTLCRFYKIPQDTIDLLITMTEMANGDGPLDGLSGDLPEWAGLYLELEREAASLSVWTNDVVFGGFQVSGYALEAIKMAPNLSQEVIESRLQLREHRQHALLERPARDITVIMGPGTWQLEVGSTQVMVEQREHLVKLNEMDGIDIRVLTSVSGAHPGAHGPFTILDFGDREEPTTVYLELLARPIHLKDADLIEKYREAFDRLRHLSIPIEEYA